MTKPHYGRSSPTSLVLLLTMTMIFPTRVLPFSVMTHSVKNNQAPISTLGWRRNTSISSLGDDSSSSAAHMENPFVSVQQICLEDSPPNDMGIPRVDIVQDLPSNVNTKPLDKLFAFYTHHLDNNPLLTKSLSASLISTCGDLVAQSFTKSKYDPIRSLSFTFEGLFISGPAMNFSFAFFERLFPTDNKKIMPLRKSINAVLQLALDTIFMDTFYVLSAFFMSGIFEGLPISLLLLKLRSELFPCLRASWMSSLALAPLEIANFRFVPKEWRTVFMNFTDVIWN
eukprot:CAMPEP_0118651956 /NCGR_PEP_ID=MMETSP0785-20121206/11059_1 /TAXON_ID=91992 /ORGANISM="Bolidomonas pacifica, Strain CCMP 1866" /LENGTH=283 /DNA_ID=CAMNT_0006544437 /DNA_START=75 /DNA_END=923 /DNA_ORIENTATION=+